LFIFAFACGPTLGFVLAAVALRPLISTATGLLVLIACVFGLVLPPIASVIPEKSSLRRHQRSPMLLALTVTVGGWMLNGVVIVAIVAMSN